ncbi:MAG TPA: hypothetical protein VMW53_07405 [archaeon]|nr:hypothetical protein [archaeon]
MRILNWLIKISFVWAFMIIFLIIISPIFPPLNIYMKALLLTADIVGIYTILTNDPFQYETDNKEGVNDE